MDSFEFNKIAGALLGTALAIFGLSELSQAIYHSPELAEDKKGFKIEVAEVEEPAEGGEAGEVKSLGVLLASASAEKGAAGAKACAACHTFEKGGANKVGPALWDIVERPHGSHEGFSYSEAMAAKKAEPWTYEALDAFIANPKGAIAGTKMAFGGIKNPAKRADIIAYLSTLADAPKPFPAP